MKYTISKWILLFVAVITAQTVCSQTIKVSGKISDRQGMAIDMATITVKDSTNKLITGCISDSIGSFSMEVTAQIATMYIHISRIGYVDYDEKIIKGSKDVVVNAKLDTATTKLDEVIVTSKMPLIHREIDRIILNAEKLNAIATNFMDVLKHTPSVIVQDDVISMLNKGKVIFLMNGRELKMDMKGLVTYLSSLSSDNLKQIEVMTTPPAKYSAEGNSGVINFVTKKLRNNYIGSYVTNELSIKERIYDGASFSLQYKHNKLEAYINTGIGFGKMQTNNKSLIYYPNETWSTTNQRLKSNNYALITAGADYEVKKNSSLGIILSYSSMHPDANVKAATTVCSSEKDTTSRYYQTFTDFNSNYNRYNTNLHYTLNNIGNGGSLSVNVDYLNYNINDRVDLETTHDEFLNYLNYPKTAIDVYQAKSDMEMPIKHATLAYGISFSQSKTDNRTNYERNSSAYDLNDHFIYREHIYAAYADLRYKFSDKWEAKLGIRGEHGTLDGNSLKLNSRTVKHQFDLFPTAYLNYSWNDDNSLSMSVSSRINRPSYVDINPFTTYIDAHTIEYGNPNLQPEKSYTSEFGYTHGDFSGTVSVMWKTHVISQYTFIDNVKRLTTITIDNVMNKQMYSLDASYYFDKVSFFDISIDGSLYMISSKPMSGYDLGKVNHISTFIYMNNNFYFNQKKTFVANLWGQYQSKEKDVAGESPSRFRMDFGLKYLLFDKKLSIGIEYQNMISSHTKSIVKSNNATYIYDSKPYRVLNLSLSYRFGKKINVKQKDFGINTNRL
jgi:hypothetical protein